MATFRPSPLIGAISGSLGAVTFKNTRHGPVICRRLRRTKKSTPALLTSRAQFRTLQLAWSLLTPAQRLAWNSFASNLSSLDRLSRPRSPSGRTLFIRHNIPALYLELPLIEDPPFYAGMPPVTDQAYRLEIGNQFWYDCTIAAPREPVYLILEGAQHIGPTTTAPPPSTQFIPPWHFKNWRTLHMQSFLIGAASVNINAIWHPVYGQPQQLQPFSLRTRIWHTGALESPRSTISAKFFFI